MSALLWLLAGCVFMVTSWFETGHRAEMLLAFGFAAFLLSVLHEILATIRSGR